MNVDYGSEGVVSFEISPDTPFDQWPFALKLECLNTILILKNLGLIKDQVYAEKYAPLVERYAADLYDLQEYYQ